MRNLFRQPEGARFSNKELLAFVFPVFFETLMLTLLYFTDNLMASAKLVRQLLPE